MNDVRVDGARLWRRLMEMAKVGGTSDGGCNRQALTDDDRRGRDLFIHWCETAGCSVRIDQMGNIFARRSGQQNDLEPVISGSHLDTQATGGKFDGVYGVIAALEVIESLNDAQAETRAPIEAVVWTNEEGSRFAPAMMGSGVWAGAIPLKEAYDARDAADVTVRHELERTGYLGEYPCQAFKVSGAFELHIEQGPILEKESCTIGVVSGIQGLRWYQVTLHGQSCHAGTTPMDCRHDPVFALARAIRRVEEVAIEIGSSARLTIGTIRTIPNSFNTVPQRVEFTLDIRHPEAATLDQTEALLEGEIRSACNDLSLSYQFERVFKADSVHFDPSCINAIQLASDQLGYRSMEIVSGAAHDSMYVSRVAKTAMIFVPCENGVSHNPDESANPKDLEAGNNVLLHAMLAMANQ